MSARVRYVDGRFYVTSMASVPGEDFEKRTRPLTRWEVLLWRLFQRTPAL